jgi:hypothetical protein
MLSKFYLGNLKGKDKPLWRPTRKWENSIKMDLTKMKCEEVDYIQTRKLLKNTFLLKSLTKQHTKIKIITYLCLIKKAAKL